MAVTEYFKNTVKQGDIQKIRIMMKNSLLSDRTFQEFSDMEILVQNFPNVYDTYDNISFIEDRDKWNEGYLDQQLVQLLNNFSCERINHLKEIISFMSTANNYCMSEKKVMNNINIKKHSRMKKYIIIGTIVILICIIILIIVG